MYVCMYVCMYPLVSAERRAGTGSQTDLDTDLYRHGWTDTDIVRQILM